MSKPKTRKRHSSACGNSRGREQDQDHILAIRDALQQEPPDVVQLRKLSAEHGLVSHHWRAQVWPLLLGLPLPASDSYSQTRYAEAVAGTHRDSAVVRCDVVRSLWVYTRGWGDEERDMRRAELRRLLDAAVCYEPEANVHYYQGLHDVASVLLFVTGEAQAFALLHRLCTVHLRDCTRSSLDPVIELLGLLQPLLAEVDPELADHLDAASLPPYFALSWFITWFAHSAKSLAEAARLFDLFLASHPLMPLYVGAVAMHNSRAVLLACSEMPELHGALVGLELPRGSPSSTSSSRSDCSPQQSPHHASPSKAEVWADGTSGSLDALLQQALRLFEQVPPVQLVSYSYGGHSRIRSSARRGRPPRIPPVLSVCVAPAAELRDDGWWVPEKSPWAGLQPCGVGARRGGVGGPLGLVRFVLTLPGRGVQGGAGGTLTSTRAKLLASTALSVTGLISVYVLAALLASRGPGPGSGASGMRTDWASLFNPF